MECDYIICELRPQYLMSIIFTKNDKKKSTVGTYKGVFECKYGEHYWYGLEYATCSLSKEEFFLDV